MLLFIINLILMLVVAKFVILIVSLDLRKLYPKTILSLLVINAVLIAWVYPVIRTEPPIYKVEYLNVEKVPTENGTYSQFIVYEDYYGEQIIKNITERYKLVVPDNVKVRLEITKPFWKNGIRVGSFDIIKFEGKP